MQDDKNGKPLPSTFGIVALKKTKYNQGYRLKTSCTLCPLGPSYRSFVQADFSKAQLPPFEHEVFLPCRHTQHIISVLFSRLELFGDNPYSSSAIEQVILDSMKEENTLFPGWYDLPFEMPLFGTFAVYLSGDWDPQVLKVRYNSYFEIYKNKAGSIRYQCLRCSKNQSRVCQHCTISCDDYGGEIYTPPVGVQSGAVRVIEDLVSYQTYPFDVLSDPNLQAMIKARAKHGSSWFSQTFPDNVLEPQIDECTACGGQEFLRIRSSRIHSFRATIYTDTEFLNDYNIFSKQCTTCTKKFPFDGREWGLVNFKDTSIFPGINLCLNQWKYFLICLNRR